jgi:hypothetical protein
MNRRNFLGASLAAPFAAGVVSAADSGENQVFVLAEFQMRNSRENQPQRLATFLEQAHLPMTKRVGVAAVGYFNVYLGESSPRIYMLTAYDSLTHMDKVMKATAADEAWTKAAKEFGSGPERAFDRVQSRLLRAFDGMKKIDVPKVSADRPPRFFDLRTYQNETFADLSEKMNMFNTEEIAIFRDSGINPVFFASTIVGDKMPNLTYMVWYDDEAARAAAWSKFLSHPDWNRIKVIPKWTNAEVTMDVGNTHLRPLGFSPIR